MRAITNRIRRLEARLAPQPDVEAYRIARILYERRRQRMEREGVPVDELPPPWAPPSDGPFNPLALTLSLAETLRRRREISSGVLDAEVPRNARARRWAESQRAEVGQR